MKLNTSISILAVTALLAIASCRKDDAPAPAQKGTVKLEFFNKAGGAALNMGNEWYKNENGDSFTITKFNYYISNIVLKGAAGLTYTEPESYHLIQEGSASSLSFDLQGVPYGTYTSVSFMIGVDSVRNASGIQSGALSVDNGMFWDWNSGYIMLKFEGVSPKSTAVGNTLKFHCGGFAGTYNVLKTVSLSLPNTIQVNELANHVHLQSDILALFKSPNKIDFSTLSVVHMPGADARMVADNYAGMFSVTYAGN